MVYFLYRVGGTYAKASVWVQALVLANQLISTIRLQQNPAGTETLAIPLFELGAVYASDDKTLKQNEAIITSVHYQISMRP